MSRLVGRDRDLASIEHLLFGPVPARILTVTGPSGIGTSRLLHEVVHRARRTRQATVVVWPTGTGDPTGGAAATAGRVVVVVDEPRLDAAQTGDLVATARQHHPGATVLVAALAPLRVPDEQVHRLEPLTSEADVVALFGAVVAARGGAPADRRHVAALCHELGGLPLAIEAAAALSEAAPPGYLLQRLAEAPLLAVLGDAAAPGARTLRSAIERTCGALDPDDRALLERLSVLPETFGLAAAVAVWGDSEGAALGGLARLAAAGVLTRLGWGGGGPRFTLPRAIREAARDRLADAEPVLAARTRFYRGVAEDTAARYAHGDDDLALGTLERERGGLSETVEHLAASGDVGGALELTVVAAVAPLSVWYDAGAAATLTRRVILAGDAAAGLLSVRARLLVARLALEHAPDLPTPHGPLIRGLLDGVEAARAYGHDDLLAEAIGFAVEGLLDAGELAVCRRLIGQAVHLDLPGAALAPVLGWSAVVLAALGQSAAAVDTMESCREQAGSAVPSRALLAAEIRLAELVPARHGPLAPDRLLAAARTLHDRHLQARVLADMARTALERGDVEAAGGRAVEALRIVESVGGAGVGTACAGPLAVLASCAAARGDGVRAVRLSEALLALAPRAFAAATRPAAAGERLTRLRETLGPAEAARVSAEVAAWDLPDLVRAGVGDADQLAAARPEPDQADRVERVAEFGAAAPAGVAGADAPGPLTLRERDVLAHLARGATNKVIGHALGISPKTVMHHSVAIYRKLGAHTRAEAAVLAIQQGLLPAKG